MSLLADLFIPFNYVFSGEATKNIYDACKGGYSTGCMGTISMYSAFIGLDTVGVLSAVFTGGTSEIAAKEAQQVIKVFLKKGVAIADNTTVVGLRHLNPKSAKKIIESYKDVINFFNESKVGYAERGKKLLKWILDLEKELESKGVKNFFMKIFSNRKSKYGYKEILK